MIDDRREGVNLLNPEGHAERPELAVEQSEAEAQAVERPRGDSPKVDQRQLQNVRSTITPQERAPAIPEKDAVLGQIENLLAENLGEIYQQLPESKREAFKTKGEAVASAIQNMVTTAKVKTHVILKLISDWLSMIPGVNVYFLRQEAKIKLDKIMDFVEEQSNNSQNSV